MRNPVGLSYLWGCFMYQYPKQILTIDQQVQSYIDAGMEITSREDIEKALKLIGFYRLRGYLNIPVRQHRKSGRRETVCPGLRKPLMRVYSRNVLSKP